MRQVNPLAVWSDHAVNNQLMFLCLCQCKVTPPPLPETQTHPVDTCQLLSHAFRMKSVTVYALSSSPSPFLSNYLFHSCCIVSGGFLTAHRCCCLYTPLRYTLCSQDPNLMLPPIFKNPSTSCQLTLHCHIPSPPSSPPGIPK